MKLTQLRRSDYQRMRWKNGLGWTTEIALRPPGAELAANDFDWRISIADVDADCDFSPLAGVDRTLMLLEGAGVELYPAGGESVLLNARGRSFDFPGEVAMRCRVLDGACRDFNVMSRRGVIEAKTMFRPLVGPMVFFAEADVTWVIHVAGGHAQVQNAPERPRLEQGDTLLIEPEVAATRGADAADAALTPTPEPRQTVLSGGGELVLVRLFRVPPATNGA